MLLVHPSLDLHHPSNQILQSSRLHHLMALHHFILQIFIARQKLRYIYTTLPFLWTIRTADEIIVITIWFLSKNLVKQVMLLTNEDGMSSSKPQYRADMAVMLGGYCRNSEPAWCDCHSNHSQWQIEEWIVPLFSARHLSIIARAFLSSCRVWWKLATGSFALL